MRYIWVDRLIEATRTGEGEQIVKKLTLAQMQAVLRWANKNPEALREDERLRSAIHKIREGVRLAQPRIERKREVRRTGDVDVMPSYDPTADALGIKRRT